MKPGTAIAILFAFQVKILTTFADDGISYRLSNGKIEVDSYTVKIIPNLKDDFDFNGEVFVIVKILEDIKCITMNSKNLNIKKVEFKTDDGGTSREVTYRLLEDREMLELCFSKTLPRYTKLEVTISFTGKMRDDFKGLYKMQYEENGSKKWLAATLLEPTYARMVFPCFDEPQYNAKFSMLIARYPDEKSISVTNLKSTSNKDPKVDNRMWDTFEPTVPSGPYLMAFAIYSFTSSTKRVKGLSIRIYSRKHSDTDAEFITSNYPNWYNTFSDYLNIYNYFDSYIDIVALPDGDEFSQRGTIMIHKEKDVFQIEGIDVEKHKEEIAKASIHKIYHLWIGAYTRLQWWSDAWLSESFGIYFQYDIANEAHPRWKIRDRFVTEVLQEALFEEEMYPDSIISSPTKSPSEIQAQKFNLFLNKKGASIINMLRQIIGFKLQRGFRNAIRKAHTDDFGITPNDLWDAINLEIKNTNLLPSEILLKTFMQTWLLSPGYPLISVSCDEYGKIIIKQEMYHSPISTNKIPDYDWIIPTFCEKSSTSGKQYEIWLRDSKPIKTDYELNKDEWILCNLKQGYYRVTYSKENWNLLIKQLKSQPDRIDHLARAQLIDDSFHLAIYNKIPFSIAFNLGTYLEKESDMLPWYSLIKYITHLLRLYEGSDTINYLKNYFLDLIKHQFNRIGFEAREDDSYTTKIGRSEILSIACKLGLSDCLTNSARLFYVYFNDLTKVPTELKYLVYCNSFEIVKDRKVPWDKLWAVYKNSQTMAEKELTLSALACANDEIMYKNYVKMTINSEEFTLFQYEKECIIKSSAKFYKGITAILDLIIEMIPKLRSQSEKFYQTLLLMAKEIHFNIASSEHVEKVKQIVRQLENDKDKYADLLESMKKSVALGTKKIEYRIKNSDEIKQTVHDITGYDQPTTSPPSVTSESPKVPSSDCRITPLMATYLIIITGIILISI